MTATLAKVPWSNRHEVKVGETRLGVIVEDQLRGEFVAMLSGGVAYACQDLSAAYRMICTSAKAKRMGVSI